MLASDVSVLRRQHRGERQDLADFVEKGGLRP
jgi:hypothetical protein